MIGDRTGLNRKWLVPVIGFLMAGSGFAETIEFRGAKFYVYRHDPKVEKLELFLIKQKIGVNPTFQTLEKQLNQRGERLKFAMNSGIYEPGFVPTGLHISDGKTIVPLNLKGAVEKTPSGFTPNFYLKPNGVFFIRHDGSAGVLAAHFFARSGEKPRLATQSGPLLLANGRIHPVLKENSTSRLIRNGVGVDSKGRVVLVCSQRKPLDAGRINLWGFAALFRDKLDCRDALYLDGDISAVHIRGETGNNVPWTNFFAGILAVVEENKD